MVVAGRFRQAWLPIASRLDCCRSHPGSDRDPGVIGDTRRGLGDLMPFGQEWIFGVKLQVATAMMQNARMQPEWPGHFGDFVQRRIGMDLQGSDQVVTACSRARLRISVIAWLLNAARRLVFEQSRLRPPSVALSLRGWPGRFRASA